MARCFWLGLLMLLLLPPCLAQPGQPNDVASPQSACYAFTNAVLVTDARTTVKGTLLIRSGLIVGAGANIAIPADAIKVDCGGKYIYPSLIDIYSDYGLPVQAPRQQGFNPNAVPQFNTGIKGAYNWNQAIRSEVNAGELFTADETRAKALRDIGFGAVLTHQKDGIARGTAAVVSLATDRDQTVLLKEKAATCYSFNKGSSQQDYPGSLMGCISLLRQTWFDAQWYKNRPEGSGINLSLQALNDHAGLPAIFEANDKWNVLRADKIGDEFGIQFIMKAGNNEYQRMSEMAATKAPFILSLNFPNAMDVEDPSDARYVALADMRNWEGAPSQPAAFEKAGIPFCLSSADLRDQKQFMASLRKAIEYGLSESRALDALTRYPAQLMGMADKTGSLEAGKMANFIICSGPLFDEETLILQNWIQGKKYVVNEAGWKDIRGGYQITATAKNGASQNWPLEIAGKLSAPEASMILGDTIKTKFEVNGNLLKISFPPNKKSRQPTVLSGVMNGDNWTGTGTDSTGELFSWTARMTSAFVPKADQPKKKNAPEPGKTWFPNNGYGFETLPQQETILIRNATVWTNEKEGKLENTDVLVRGGKIVAVGKGLSATGATVVDGTGKHLTAGIIDEHSHIAGTGSINECTQSVTSEVRIGDILNPDDINIYRQLAGGVTASHILHGSCNTIGGQTQLIKLRWGVMPEQLKFAGWDPFIKFALGENVKRSSSATNPRYPDSRMGVEQVLVDGFTRARDYERAGAGRRRDLELDALSDILNKKMFITCHSYVQSEINMLMKVADRFGFKVNTFTHILEGYKVADKMRQHGAGAAGFADWWAYKMEVYDAIPQNAWLLQKSGVLTAINSDDAEMARRLNQEAAKSIKYAGMNEEDALKLVTLNPARLLHVDDRVGSIKAGKDADLVLWTDHPLSIYAKAEKTMVDGIIYYDMNRDAQLRKRIKQERARLIQKMQGEKRRGAPTMRPVIAAEVLRHCDDSECDFGFSNMQNDY